MTSPPGIRFVRARGVKEKSVGSDLALYVERERAIHVPNEPARLIWECLREPLTFAELLFVLAEAFDADRPALAADLQETLDAFERHLLIQRVTGPHGTPVP